MGISEGISIQVSAVSGQKEANVDDVPPDVTVGELVQGLLSEMNLPKNDVQGQPLKYQAQRERDGLHLPDTDRVGDALETGDRLVLHPNIDAG